MTTQTTPRHLASERQPIRIDRTGYGNVVTRVSYTGRKRQWQVEVVDRETNDTAMIQGFQSREAADTVARLVGNSTANREGTPVTTTASQRGRQQPMPDTNETHYVREKPSGAECSCGQEWNIWTMPMTRGAAHDAQRLRNLARANARRHAAARNRDPQ